MSEHDHRPGELDSIETARQVHTLAQRLLQHVSPDERDKRGDCELQPEPSAESKVDDQPVTYWYP